jgi:aerobic C4-dicarboxylate transport protein
LRARQRLAGLSIFRFLAYLREEADDRARYRLLRCRAAEIMRKLEWMGVKKSVAGLVIPTGYSFNLDAFSIYLTLATA